jgi:TonB family protein
MSWWHYILLVNIYLVLFFGFYALLLRRETFFQLNRVYLVAASLLSFFIPLIQSGWVQNLFITRAVEATIYNTNGPVMQVYNFTPAKNNLTIGDIFNWVYIAVTLLLVLRLIWQLVILKKAIEKPEPSAAYSFFKKISLGDNLSGSAVIAEHEQVHASQWHSADVLIIEAVMIINWFNPVVYLYRFAIKYIHEFIADKEVIQAGTDKADYALLLLTQTFDVPANNLLTPFYNHSLLKKRITMLQKNRSQRISLAKYGLSAPLFMLMLVLSSATINNSKVVRAIGKKSEKVLSTHADKVTEIVLKNNKAPELAPVTITDTVPSTNKIYAQVAHQPEYPGGIAALYEYLGKNTRYPAIDRENKIQGKVYVSFVVERDGSITDVKAIHGPSETLNKEAARVVAAMSKWNPGYQNGKPVRVSFTMPISFTLNSQPVDIHNSPNTGNNNQVYSAVERQPQFPGGLIEFYHFLSKNIKYPDAMRRSNIQGKVYVQFVVETDGTLSGIKAVRGPGYGAEEEAVRVMWLSPNWQPGTQNGKPVRVAYTIPINFTLGNNPTPVHGTVIDTSRRIGAVDINDKAPVFIIDGVVSKQSDFAKLDPNLIESFSVLKAATAAFNGEEAPNGVILVTTNRKRDIKKVN